MIPRPCACDSCKIGEPWTKAQCWRCWLYHNESRYNRLWGGDGKVVQLAKPGMELKSLILELKLADSSCFACDAKAIEMDRWGPAGCREHHGEIVAHLKEQADKRGWTNKLSAASKLCGQPWFSLIDPYGSLVDEAIRRAEANSKPPFDTAQRRSEEVRPIEPRRMKWAYGLTTVPERKDDMFPRTLASLKAAGFESPRLFVDNCTHHQAHWYEQETSLDVTSRFPRIRTYGNWILGLAELYIRNPAADRYAMFQDDFVTVRNLRQYLEACPWPDKGYLNLYTFMENEEVVKDKPTGWHLTGPTRGASTYHGRKSQAGRGAVALVFTLQAVQTLLVHQNIVERVTNVQRGWRKVDGGVVEAMNAADWWEHVHNPSLVQHIGAKSAMGNSKRAPAKTFPGEAFDAMEFLQPIP